MATFFQETLQRLIIFILIWIVLTLHEDYESGTGIFHQIKQNLFTNNESHEIQDNSELARPITFDGSTTVQSSTMLTQQKQQSSGTE